MTSVQSTHICRECLQPCENTDQCPACGESKIVDTAAPGVRSEFVEDLRERAKSRRKRFIWVMEAMAIAFCAGVLFVGVAIARGLGGGAVEWGAKLFAVGLLAGCWIAIPRIYSRYLRGRASAVVVELDD